MNKVYTVLTAVFLSLGCSILTNNQLDNKVKEAYDNCSSQDTCTIDLETSFSFQWEKMYVFGINATPDYISKTIGINFNESTDLTRIIVFTKKGEIAQTIRDGYNPEKVFNVTFQDSVKHFMANNSKFRIKKTDRNYQLILEK